jgi:hypothetical protein
VVNFLIRSRGHTSGPSPAGFASLSYCLKVIFQQFHDELLIARATPAIAINAADQRLSVIVDCDERALAMRALHWKRLEATHRFLMQHSAVARDATGAGHGFVCIIIVDFSRRF